ncbi:sensor domain-containing diguanylate cyclase [Pusillimonas minor]|uniref:diguanylate cyclase n=1 Tax=Pusillimonas minor TaxID=2697024 RepID=A0A842HMV8_9BURK|nr:sensor domain-containing diguanylate cyclase [Pusillimonas minor]MBC2768908.1 diguanylate cyclase [Pusillimonas minor]
MFSSFRAQLMLALGGLALIVSVGLIVYVDQASSEQLATASKNRLASVSDAIAQTLATSITERKRAIVVLSQAPSLLEKSLDDDAIQGLLEDLQDAYPDYAWVGVADAKGTVRSAANDMLEGKSVANRPWFIEGIKGPHLGDLHEAVLLAQMLPNHSNEPLRFVDFAAPIIDNNGNTLGVLATHAQWSWVTSLIESTVSTGSLSDGIEVFVINSQNEILYPYAKIGKLTVPDLSGAGQTPVVWADGGLFLTSTSAVSPNTSTQLGWKVVVRQPVELALAPVEQLRKRLALFGLLVVAIAMLVAYILARRTSRPIERLHRVARDVLAGAEAPPEPRQFKGPFEIRELYRAFHDMTLNLLQRKTQLEAVNASLEQTINERTAQLRGANEHLEQLARRDSLTGLLNRLAATERLKDEFLRYKRNSTPYAVLMLDIDHFKRINDTYGHHAGDRALQGCAAVLSANLRESDFIARFGGEEFIVILPDTSLLSAHEVAVKICLAISQTPPAGVDALTISVGVACARPAHLDKDDMAIVHDADQALYRAKANGRNRVETYTANDALID